MSISLEPHFEVRLRADQHSWEIMVTWGHALRHVVEGACFQVRTYTPSVDRTAVIALDGSAESRPAKTGSSEDPQAGGETASQVARYLHQEYSTELAHSFQRSGT